MLHPKGQKVKNHQGSSFVSPAHGCGGARATIEFNNSPSAKKSGEARKQAGKKEMGLGEGIFARLLCPAKRGWGWESVSTIPASAGRQNRKIFVPLIEKNFGGARLKNCKKNFSVLSAVRRAETLGGLPAGRQGFNPQNPLDFAQKKFGFRPANTTIPNLKKD